MGDYYVDNEAPFDGDGGIATPWDNISGHIGALGPGDTMHVRGDPVPSRIYTESPITMGVSGTSGNLITLRAFAGEHVTLRTTPQAWNTTLLLDGDYLAVQDLNFDKEGYGGTQILLHDCSHSVIRGCELENNGGDGALFFQSGAGLYSGSDVLVEDCIIHDTWKSNNSDSHGILIAGNRTDITISYCTIYDICGDCITPIVNCGTGILIENCHLYTTIGKCSENAVDTKDGEVTIRDCVMHGFRYCDASCGGSGGGIGEAVLCHDDVIFLVVEYCEIFDCASGVKASSNTAACYIQKNVFYDFVTDGATWLNCGVYIYANSGNTVYVWNNTFVELPQHLWRVDSTGDAEFKNNLAYETHTITIQGGATVVYDYNGWYNVLVGDQLVGANDTTGAGDPGFVDAANDNYELAAGSAVIDQGVNVGLPFYGSAPDLGYDEWEGEGTSTSTTTTSTSTTSTSTTLTSTTTTLTSTTSISTSTTATSLSTSTTSTSLSTTSTSTTSTSTTSSSTSTTSTSTTSTSTTTTLRLRFWLHRGIITTRYGVR